MAPTAAGSYLPLTFTQNGFSKHPQNFSAIHQLNFTDAQTGRFVLEYHCEAFARNRPHFQCDRGSASFRTHHCRMAIADGPEAIHRSGLLFTNESSADGNKIGIQFESAHQRAINGKKNHRTAGHNFKN